MEEKKEKQGFKDKMKEEAEKTGKEIKETGHEVKRDVTDLGNKAKVKIEK